jgi:hypothetical protein
MNLWENDNVQFMRLICEINAIGLTDGQLEQLEVAMDLDREFIFELFDRAEIAWCNQKQKLLKNINKILD